MPWLYVDVKTGHHNAIDTYFSRCPLYSLKTIRVVEKEQHFLLVCPLYVNLRVLYLRRCWMLLRLCVIEYVLVL